ncbi:TPA: hypothetical protein ACGPB3_000353 [Streptococcus suis]
MNRDKKPGMETVKIGGIVYEVSKKPDLQGKSGEWGHIEYKTGKIVLDDSTSQQIEDQTLIHEITHGILIEAGYVQHEEEQADRIGKILYQVLTDNDFGWLWKGGNYEQANKKEMVASREIRKQSRSIDSGKHFIN